jgi:hypothetical protein
MLYVIPPLVSGGHHRSYEALTQFQQVTYATVITFLNFLHIRSVLGLLQEPLSKQACPTFLILHGKKRLPYYAYTPSIAPRPPHKV